MDAKLIQRLQRLVNDPRMFHRARRDIREAIAALKVAAKQAEGKKYTGTPVKVPLTAQEKRDITNFTGEES